jgi:hypothetical protein
VHQQDQRIDDPLASKAQEPCTNAVVPHATVGATFVARRAGIWRAMRIDSGEVDVALESSITGAFQQSKQHRALSRPGPTPDDDDDTEMRLALRQSNEVVPVAGHQDAPVVVRGLEDH